jgi:hypothetical protein
MEVNAVPADVVDWLRAVFAECNARITEKLSSNPNVSEESLDQTWVEHLSHFSSPIELASGWLVRIETHYLGGMRHFGNFEIADIGLLYFLRTGGEIVRSKVALLQSKRLYPTTGAVEEEGVIDYRIGFARLADPETLSRSLSVQAEYQFSSECRFGAILAGSEQVELIDEYAERSQLRIYYQLYGPWNLPHTRRVPSPAWKRPYGKPALGVRVLPVEVMHQLLASHDAGFRPRVADLASSDDGFADLGWPVEQFVADELVGCREGSPFGSISDASIQNLFYRRSGPIAAAVSITIEAPLGAG